MKQLILVFFLFTATIGANGVAAASPHSPMPNSSASKTILKETSGKETHFQTQGAVPWTYKAFKNALRTGGWLLSQAIKPFSKKTADWIRKNSKKVADWMDQGEKWTEKQFSKTLQKIGAPKDVADSLAKFMISLL